MDLEARSLQPSVKAVLLAKLREYKSDLNQLKKEFKRIASPNASQAAREELLESGVADSHLVSLSNLLYVVLVTSKFYMSWNLTFMPLISYFSPYEFV